MLSVCVFAVHATAGRRPLVLSQQEGHPQRHQAGEPTAGTAWGPQDRRLWLVCPRTLITVSACYPTTAHTQLAQIEPTTAHTQLAQIELFLIQLSVCVPGWCDFMMSHSVQLAVLLHITTFLRRATVAILISSL